ncbi:MAG: tRNA threonylcarbamoyladenosine biosynthesis protein TsaB [Candidatus Azotimanducaceae bacterium]
MNTLLIDTSTRATVLGLDVSGELIDRTMNAENSHSREILPSIERLVSDAGIELGDLTGIVFGQGPGSFTGLRIAVGVVQGLGYGLDIPVVPVSSMACLAQSQFAQTVDQTDERNHVFVGLSARLDEIYFGAYTFDEGIAHPVTAEGVCDVDDLPRLVGEQGQAKWLGVGDAFRLKDRIESATGIRFSSTEEQTIPLVASLLRLGQVGFESGSAIAAIDASPVYLREKVADKPAQKTAPKPGKKG